MKTLHLLITGTFVLIITGCEEKEQASDQDGNQVVAIQTYWTSAGTSIGRSGNASGAHVEELEAEVLARVTTPTEGYYRFRAKIKRGFDLYTGRDVKFLPMMYANEHPIHSSPVEQPNGPSDDGYYYGAVFFMKPAIPNHHWRMHVIIGERDTHTFLLDVSQHPWHRVRPGYDFTPLDSFSYFYEVKPVKYTNGDRDVLFLVYRRDRAQPIMQPSAFLLASNITQIDLRAWPSDAGHTAISGPHSATPISGKPGQFLAKKVFDKPGLWKMTVSFREGENVVLRDSFSINVY
ncbi:MAG: hypothetical protein N2200_09290 [Bacteroidia bacterium]|nr:hypothetical protein [Bacteroidia bacterium]MDW8416179.1 hypothetical protein [Bacteroidia bacterium]